MQEKELTGVQPWEISLIEAKIDLGYIYDERSEWYKDIMEELAICCMF
jgi:hypothetical protein